MLFCCKACSKPRATAARNSNSSTPFNLSAARLNYAVRHDYLARQALPCHTAVARLAFKRRANIAPNLIHKLI